MAQPWYYFIYLSLYIYVYIFLYIYIWLFKKHSLLEKPMAFYENRWAFVGYEII